MGYLSIWHCKISHPFISCSRPWALQHTNNSLPYQCRSVKNSMTGFSCMCWAHFMLALIWQVLPAVEEPLKYMHPSKRGLLQRGLVHHQGKLTSQHQTRYFLSNPKAKSWTFATKLLNIKAHLSDYRIISELDTVKKKLLLLIQIKFKNSTILWHKKNLFPQLFKIISFMYT
jgi:hypothetical protein